jgi:hypothetical protein
VSRDPIEYDSDDVNLFRYVENCSGNWVDPYGFSQRRESIDPHQEGIKGQGRGSKEKKKQKDNWKPHNEQPPKNPPKHTPGRGHRKGFINNKVLGGLFLLDCEGICALNYKDCLDNVNGDYESCLESANSMSPSLQKNAISLCNKILYLDMTACGATYTACGLACLCPFQIF